MRVVLTALAIALIASCKSPTAPDDITLGTSFDLKADASVELPDGFRIKFDRVSADSRCPIDVQCVTAGDATLVLLVSNKGNNSVPLELHTTGAGSQISHANHTIRLTALQPFRRSNRQISALEYVATLVVSAP